MKGFEDVWCVGEEGREVGWRRWEGWLLRAVGGVDGLLARKWELRGSDRSCGGPLDPSTWDREELHAANGLGERCPRDR